MSEPIHPTTDQHTPGPWWVDNRRPVGALQIQGRHRGEGSSYCVASVNYYEDDAANASLIAAAPELLALAKQYARECADCSGKGELGGAPCDACADIRAVIDKAEGRSPDDKRHCECGYGCPPFQGCRHD